jgi:hypothetical protein
MSTDNQPLDPVENLETIQTGTDLPTGAGQVPDSKPTGPSTGPELDAEFEGEDEDADQGDAADASELPLTNSDD